MLSSIIYIVKEVELLVFPLPTTTIKASIIFLDVNANRIDQQSAQHQRGDRKPHFKIGKNTLSNDKAPKELLSFSDPSSTTSSITNRWSGHCRTNTITVSTVPLGFSTYIHTFISQISSCFLQLDFLRRSLRSTTASVYVDPSANSFLK